MLVEPSSHLVLRIYSEVQHQVDSIIILAPLIFDTEVYRISIVYMLPYALPTLQEIERAPISIANTLNSPYVLRMAERAHLYSVQVYTRKKILF